MKTRKEQLNRTICVTINKLGTETAEDFHSCGLRHENVKGYEYSQIRYVNECPREIQNKRVGCPHGKFLETLRSAYDFLKCEIPNESFATVRMDETWDFETKLTEVDTTMRLVNKILWCSENDPKKRVTLNLDRDKDSAEIMKKQLEQLHDQYVKEILKRRDELVRILCKLLFQS